MDVLNLIQSLLLGILEGLTEFIPVSSTAHLLLAAKAMGFRSPHDVFEVLIQLGSILAIVVFYFGRLWNIAKAAPHDTRARHFITGILIAFLPAVFLGVLLHDIIKNVFFESPRLICWSLIIGGIVLLVVDKLPLRPRYSDAQRYPWKLCLIIGFFQCLAMIPGTSRSGATIVGALLCGADKRSAAEFSFYLAMPTMLGAFVYDFYKNANVISWHDGGFSILVGFIAAFIAGLFVVRHLLSYISSHGYAVFAWWRIIVGLLGFFAIYCGVIS